MSGNLILQSETPIEPFARVIEGWESIGDVRLHLDRLHPLSSALPTSIQIDIPANATAEVGIMNTGWWGMDASPQVYNASFYVSVQPARYMDNTTTFTVSLRSNLTGETFASSSFDDIKVNTFEYINLNTSFHNNVTAPDSNNTFAITMNATEVAGQTFFFSRFSLFPETFKGYRNGLRKDVAEALYDMRPKVLRFPGGNNLEGVSVDSRWKWYEHVGPLKERPGRPGNWNYYNTRGLGLLEYLEWAEAMDAEPVLGVYAGFSLDVWGQMSGGVGWIGSGRCGRSR